MFDCLALGIQIELTDEREDHIELRHSDLLPEHLEELQLTVENPQETAYSILDGNLMLARWTDRIKGGRFVVAVVAEEPAIRRHWIVTAFISRQLPDEMQ